MDQQQQPEEQQEQDATNRSKMLERLWKSHPWKSDMADKPINNKRASLGPAPSVSKAISWAQQVEADEVSLGEDAILNQTQQEEGPLTTSSHVHSALCTDGAQEDYNNSNTYMNEDDYEDDEELNLLDIDLDDPENAQAMRDAIGEEVLAMWDAQGLYEDLPELRSEILKGVVESKFVALQKEQKEQRAAMPLMNSSLATCNIHIIEEEEDSEEASTSGNSDEGRVNNMQASTKEPVEPPQQEDLPTTTTTTTALDTSGLDERYALQAFSVLEELQQRLPLAVDTTDHEFIEAEGRLGNLPPKEVPIKDVHAFNKYKLHDAVERRVSQIFTGDHQVVERTKDSDGNVIRRSSSRRASLPTLPSEKQEPEESAVNMKEVLSMSFSVFDAFVQSKQQQQQALVQDDEWTEYTESLGDEEVPKKEDLRKVAADMDETLKHYNSRSRNSDEGSFTEMTINDKSVVVDVDDVSEQRSEQRGREEKRQRQRKQPQAPAATAKATPTKKSPTRTASNDVSYMEFTVYDEKTVQELQQPPLNTRKASMITKSGNACYDRAEEADENHLASDRQYPTITTTQQGDAFDDDMTAITFDHSVEGGASTTQDHVLASAYLNKPWRRDRTGSSNSPTNRVPPSPIRKNLSGVDSQQTETTHMDESSMSQQQRHGESSVSSDSAAGGAALKKSVAKILRVDIWSPKATVVESALERLGQAAQHGSAQRTNIARLGGVMAIVRAMQMHSQNVTIQVKACQALEYLSVDSGTQAAVTEVGGMAAVVQAMRCHSKEQEVQAAACNVLAAITSPQFSDCSGASDSYDEEDSPLDGLVTTLVTAMNQHPKNTEIQAKAFGALANLCLDNQESLRELSESGGLTSMTMALQRPWKDKTDQHEAISTLSILLRSLAELDSSQHELDVSC